MFKYVLFLFSLPILAQTNATLRYVTSAPSGSCATRAQPQIVVSTGSIYTCAAGTWSVTGTVSPTGTVTVVTGTTREATITNPTTTPNVHVIGVNNVQITGVPTSGQAPVATGPTSASWQTVSSTGALPAGSGTELNARSTPTTFQALPGSSIVPPLGKPANLVVTPTCAGTCMTTYGYIINVFNGIGFTPDSTEVTVLNAATLDMTHFNTVTFPTIANAKCTISRSTGPTTGILIDTNACDGSTFPDNTANVDQMQTITPITVDTTGGVALLGQGFPTSGAGAPIVGGICYAQALGAQCGSFKMIANRQNLNVSDGRGNVAGGPSTAYLGAEFLAGIGYYLETDLFQNDEIGANQGVCTDANAIFKPCPNGRPGPTVLRSTSATIMGALTIGACNTATVTVTGATTAMPVVVTPVSNPDSGAAGLVRWDGYVSSANTVTVRECGLGVVTPNATAYNVAVIP